MITISEQLVWDTKQLEKNAKSSAIVDSSVDITNKCFHYIFVSSDRWLSHNGNEANARDG